MRFKFFLNTYPGPKGHTFGGHVRTSEENMWYNIPQLYDTIWPLAGVVLESSMKVKQKSGWSCGAY